MLRIVTKSLHSYLDYPVAIGLMVMPFLLNLGGSHPLAFGLSVVTGVAALLLTLLTDHQFGVIKVIPYAVHLAVDAAVGVVFVIAPFVLGFAGLDAVYYWVVGATVLVVVGLHSPEDETVVP